MPLLRTLPAVLALSFALPAAAQNLINQNTTIQSNLCVGAGCFATETYVEPVQESIVRIDNNQVRIEFVDGSNPASDFPSNDWSIFTNDAAESGASYFAIEDDETGFVPFRVEAGAPTSALVVNDIGNLGLGTLMPQDKLHAISSFGPALRLERSGNAILAPQIWQVMGQSSFSIADTTAATFPFRINRAAPTAALLISGNGNVGLGTAAPTTALHLSRDDGSARVLVENTATAPSEVREMFAMRNNGGSYFTLDNTRAGTTWFFTHENAAPNRFIISDAVADGPEFSLTAGGDVIIPGNFISGATTLNVPDYVFADDYALRPLSEVQAFIADNRHLPDVPSAAEIAAQGLDMTDMQMRLLKKVEELTLYMLEQEVRLAEVDALRAETVSQAADLARLRGVEAENAALAARLARVEAVLALE